MASRNTKQRKEVKDDDDDEIKNIYDICGIPGLFKNILKFLKVKSILKMSESCLVKNLGHASFNECVSEAISKPKQLYELYQRYGNEFEGRSALICACDRGRMNDVLLFVNLHRFHKYIEMNGVKEGNMTLNEMVNQVGRSSYGVEYTPLMIAASNEHFQVVEYLIEQDEADPNIADSDGWIALHYAACYNRTNTEMIELLLTHMSLDSINKKNGGGWTPLDLAYRFNDSPIQQEIIALIRSKGGKANYHDANGRWVGDDNGDLNKNSLDKKLTDEGILEITSEYLIGQAEMQGLLVRVNQNTWNWLS